MRVSPRCHLLYRLRFWHSDELQVLRGLDTLRSTGYSLMAFFYFVVTVLDIGILASDGVEPPTEAYETSEIPFL